MENKSSRMSDNIPYNLRGTYVTIKGTVVSMRNSNPFTKSKAKSRQKMILLSPVYIAGERHDHTWVHGNNLINSVSLGDEVTFFSKLGVYHHNGLDKWYPKFPYMHFSVEKATSYRSCDYNSIIPD